MALLFTWLITTRKNITGVEATTVNGSKYLVVILDFSCNYTTKVLTTNTEHYKFDLDINKWIIVNSYDIDSTIFSNLKSLITDSSVVYNKNTQKTTTIYDQSIYVINEDDEITDVMKPEYEYFWDYLAFGALGLSIKAMTRLDIKNKLSKNLTV